MFDQRLLAETVTRAETTRGGAALSGAGVSGRSGWRPLMVLAVLVLGFGLSGSVFERPGGHSVAAPDGPPAAVTRLVYSGPMPVVNARSSGKGKTVSVRPSQAPQDWLPWLWLEPTVPSQPVSLPSIPNFDLISEAKVATVKGRPIAADPLFNPANSTSSGQREEPVTRLMTKMPTPTSPGSVVPQTFCQGFC